MSIFDKDQRTANALARIEQALVDKHIWNTDMVGVKYVIANAYDKAIDAARSPLITLLHKHREENPHQDYSRNPYHDALEYTGHGLLSAASNLRLQRKKAEIIDFVLSDEGRKAHAALMAVYEEGAAVWLKIKALKPFVVKGRKPSENPRKTPPRTIDNTGTCAVCGMNVKMDGGRIVAHGYQIYWHQRSQDCFGVGHQAWEVSAEGAEAYLKWMKDILPGLKANLKALQEKNEDSKAARMARNELSGNIRGIESTIPMFTKKVAEWKPDDLPEVKARRFA